MKTFALQIRIPASAADFISERLWQDSALLGIQELPDNGQRIFAPAPGWEVLEFGTAAAEKCAEWLEKDHYRAGGSLVLEIHFAAQSFDPQYWTQWGERLEVDSGHVITLLAGGEVLPRDYLAEYRRSVRGQNVGQNLWVGPPWDSAPPGKKAFFVEPALAFGTGEHPTTQLCLESLEELSQTFRPQRILDVGSGSGILAAAARVFFPTAEIIATDLDPLCEESFWKTFELNHLDQSRVQMRTGPAANLLHGSFERELGTFDLIVSNIYAEVLATLCDTMHRLMRPQAKWILSGILAGAPERILQNAWQGKFLCQKQKSRVKMQDAEKQEKETWLFMELERKNDFDRP